MSDYTSTDFQQTAKKILESRNIYYFQNLFGLSNPSTYPNEEMFHDAVRAGLRRLALRFHPDKNPEMGFLAEEVMKKLGNVSRHFIEGEELYASTHLLDTDFESFTDIQLLERIEALLDPLHKSFDLPPVLQSSLPALVEEAKKRALKDKKFMKIKTPQHKRLLYLAVRWEDDSLFLWLCAHGDFPSLDDFPFSPLHFLIVFNRRDTLDHFISLYGEVEFKKICLDNILNFKEEYDVHLKVLDYFVNYLISKEEEIPITAFDNNPYLIHTALGESFSAEERFAFIMKNIKQYSKLYYLLTPKQQIEPFAVLSQYERLNGENYIPYLFFNELQSKGLSPYFSKALSDKFPRIEDWAKRLGQKSPGAIFFSSLFFQSFGKEFQFLVFGSLVLFSLMLGLVLLGLAQSAVPGGTAILAIGLVVAACASIVCVYQQIRTYIEKVKINKILNENNFFKKAPAVEITRVSIGEAAVAGDTSDASDAPDELWMSMV